MNNINNAIAQAIQAVKSAFPTATEPELNKILVDLQIVAPIPTPATPIAPKSTIDAIYGNIDKLVANEKNNTNTNTQEELNMNEFKLTGTTTEISWKDVPTLAPIRSMISDAKCNRITWLKYLTDDFGFENLNRINAQISALAAMYPEDNELTTIAEIIGLCGTILKWGDLQVPRRNQIYSIITYYQEYVVIPETDTKKRAEALLKVCDIVNSSEDILADEAGDFTLLLNFLGTRFYDNVKNVERLNRISKLTGDTNNNTNAKANNCTKKNK